MAIVGLHHALQDAHGEDTLQALALAMQLARTLLADFIDRGGWLMYPDGTDFDLSAHFAV